MKSNVLKQSGAVWVEFLVAASTVLLSLFFLIPMLGKYIDVRHSTENAARYAAWEKTVWHGNKISKSVKEIENESLLRIIGDSNTLVFSTQKDDSSLSDFKLSSLHHFQNSSISSYDELLFKNQGASNKYMSLTEEVEGEAPGIGGEVKSILNALKSPVLEGGVPVNKDGYFTETVTLAAKTPGWIGESRNLEGNSVFPKNELGFSVSNSILVDGWGAGGKVDNANKIKQMKAKGQHEFLYGSVKLMQPFFTPFGFWAKELWWLEDDIERGVDLEQLLDGEDPDAPLSHLGKYN